MEILNDETIQKHNKATVFHICEEEGFDDSSNRRKLFDHDHLTGKY